MNRVRVLLVDDDENTLICLAIDLRMYGCIVHKASNGREALKMVRNGSVGFDIVVTDWKMPHMYGDELIEELRADGLTQPMILWTGSLPLPDCPDATMVLSKCVGKDGLLAAMRQCLAQP